MGWSRSQEACLCARIKKIDGQRKTPGDKAKREDARASMSDLERLVF